MHVAVRAAVAGKVAEVERGTREVGDDERNADDKHEHETECPHFVESLRPEQREEKVEESEQAREDDNLPQQRVAYRCRRARQCREGDAQRLRLTADGAHRAVQERRVRAEVIQQQKIDIDDHGTPPFRSPFGK